ncbi:MAG: MaoC/PaaZ C-terminal domain-containing protein [Planctomycetota bacterium]
MSIRKNEVWSNGIPEVGQKALRYRAVTARDIELFTEISGDRNPLHYDEKIARSTRPLWRHSGARRCHQRNPECSRG